MKVIIMGVSGSGKTTLGRALSVKLGHRFIEGDDLHPPANIAKMSAGIPLTDDDRWPWLEQVGRAVAGGSGGIVSCSALRRVYRDRLRDIVGPDLAFVCLALPRHELERRMQARTDHFMPSSLLDSQLALFEPPGPDENDVVLVSSQPLEVIVGQSVQWLRRSGQGNVG